MHERAILTPINEMADEINYYVLSMAPDTADEYFSYDSIATSTNTVSEANMFYPFEFLNTICINNFPHYKLVLKIGSSIMLLRNLS